MKKPIRLHVYKHECSIVHLVVQLPKKYTEFHMYSDTAGYIHKKEGGVLDVLAHEEPVDIGTCVEELLDPNIFYHTAAMYLKQETHCYWIPNNIVPTGVPTISKIIEI